MSDAEPPAQAKPAKTLRCQNAVEICPVETTLGVMGGNWNDTLTELGLSLRPVLPIMIDWGKAHKHLVRL